MIFIETPIFTKQIKALFDDEAYGSFQEFLAENPEGDLIKGTGGLRKIRMALPGRGKARAVAPASSTTTCTTPRRSVCCWPTRNPNKTT